MYGIGAVMGFAPEVVDRMTMWEFSACADGYAEAHGAKKSAPSITDDQYEALVALGDRWNAEAKTNGSRRPGP
jgi:hypothetical protein